MPFRGLIAGLSGARLSSFMGLGPAWWMDSGGRRDAGWLADRPLLPSMHRRVVHPHHIPPSTPFLCLLTHSVQTLFYRLIWQASSRVPPSSHSFIQSAITIASRTHASTNHAAQEGESREGVCQRAGGDGAQLLVGAEVCFPPPSFRRWTC